MKFPIEPQPRHWQGANEPADHHGDLRKGAFLKRRAAYQLQADTQAPAQAGTLGSYPRVHHKPD